LESVRFLSTKIHGAFDYLVGLALILAPNIFHFADVGGAAVLVPRVLGVGLIVYSLMTRYEWGLYKLISTPYHLMVDLVAALFLALAPFLFGFSNKAPNAWLPHVVVGVAIVVVVLVSKTQPGSSMATRVTTGRPPKMPAE
jgi:uncharacterized membrane protein YoaK (UPF0700 family)